MKIFLVILSITGWFALITQFYLHINSGIAPVPELLLRYFSYFTILTNLMIAIYSTVLWLAPNTGPGRFFIRSQTGTAIAVYITIVGITYNLILRSVWQPEGLQQVVDELLHVVMPVLFVLYWCFFVLKTSLQWKDFLPWLIYPFLYLLLALVRGTFSGFYPYPFINVDKIGLQQALVNAAGIAVLFLVLSLVFIGIGKLGIRKKMGTR